MLTYPAPPPATPERGPNQPPSADAVASRELALRLSRPTSTSVGVHIAGVLDASTTSCVLELLAPRLASSAETVILDLSKVEFVDAAGLELLKQARRRAAHGYMTICLVLGPGYVQQALRTQGWAVSAAMKFSPVAAK